MILQGFLPSGTNGKQNSLEDDDTIFDNLIRATRMKIMDQKNCANLIGNRVIQSEAMFCAGQHKDSKTTCRGDAGSPLRCNGIVYGVATLVPNGTPCGSGPSVFTRVSHILDWAKRIKNTE